MAFHLMTIALGLAASTQASPLPDNPTPMVEKRLAGTICTDGDNPIISVNAGYPHLYNGPWTLATGVSCIAPAEGSCNLGQSYSVTKGVSWTVGGDLGLTV